MTEIGGYEVLGLGIYFEDLPIGSKQILLPPTIGRCPPPHQVQP